MCAHNISKYEHTIRLKKLLMKLPLTLICIFYAFFSKKTFGQQDPHFTQYMFNTMSINSAYAGSRGQPVITALARTQMIGFEGVQILKTLVTILLLVPQGLVWELI